MSNPSTISRQLLTGLINAVNVKQWLESELVFGQPTPVVGQDWNTTLPVTAVADQIYTGTVTLQYSRVNLATIIGEDSTDFDLDDAYDNTTDLVPLLIERFGYLIDTTDIVSAALPSPDGEGVITVIVQAHANSLLWRGQLSITLTPVVVPIDTLIATTELDGFVLSNLLGN
jgi:hypothetical protein